MSLKPMHAALLAAIVGAVPAFAKDHGEGHGNKGRGHDKQERKHDDASRGPQDVRPGAFFNEQHREFAHRYYVEHYGDGHRCPPGLAKKNNGCMPPGQARKWAVGEPIPRGVVVYPVPQPVLVQLPPPPVGFRYSRVGADIVLVRVQGNVVVDIMLNVFG